MNINIKEEGDAKVLTLEGRLDLASGKDLKEEIVKICKSGVTRIHLNLEQVEFINSSGLGALISTMKEVRLNKGRLTLSDLAPYVKEIFDITQLTHVFEIHPSERDAFASQEPITTN